MKVSDINIGDIVCTENGFEMVVVGLFAFLDRDTGRIEEEGACATLDWAGNEGDPWEEEVKDLQLVRKHNELKRKQ